MSGLAGNKNYHRLFWATGINNLGDGIAAMAVPWLATLITRDPLLIACVSFGQRLPWLLFALPAGVVTDRADRRALIVRCDLIRFVLGMILVMLAFSLPESPSTPLTWIAALTGLTFALGCAELLRDNAAQTMLPSLVASEDLETANGRMWSAEHVTTLIGPPLAGLLIALALPLPFLVDAASFAVAALLIAGLTLPARPTPARRKLREEMAEGWAWMRAHPVILRLALMLGVFNFASMMAMALLVLYAQDILNLGALGHGMLLACGAAGGICGGIFGPKLAARIGPDAACRTGIGLNVVGLAILASTAHPILAGLSEGIMMFGGVLWNVVTVSYRQRHIPDALLGRVNAIYRFFGWGTLPLAALAGGAIAQTLEPAGRDTALRAPFVLGAALTLGLLIYALAKLRLNNAPKLTACAPPRKRLDTR